MINIEKKKDCCGCSACAMVCGHKAITMTEDEFGFKYPKVNEKLCTDCGLCEKVCPLSGDYDKPDFQTVIAARHKDISELEKSRSGAVFVALSNSILDDGGTVYGAGFSEDLRIVHKRTETKVERDELRGSKYVQSDMGNTFRTIRKDLREGKKVLFTGTPCQTAALRSYLGRNYEDLYIADIICHGTSSPKIWRDYLKFIETINRKRIKNVNFRDKQLFGWSSHQESFVFKNKDKKQTFPFKFYNDLALRPACYSCRFANTDRPSDITLGDFWGWEKSVPEFNKDNRGISLLLINTEKGKLLFERISGMLNYKVITLEEAMQPNLRRPTPIPPNRDKYINDYAKYGFFVTSLKHKQIRLLSVIKTLIKSLI